MKFPTLFFSGKIQDPFYFYASRFPTLHLRCFEQNREKIRSLSRKCIVGHFEFIASCLEWRGVSLPYHPLVLTKLPVVTMPCLLKHKVLLWQKSYIGAPGWLSSISGSLVGTLHQAFCSAGNLLEILSLPLLSPCSLPLSLSDLWKNSKEACLIIDMPIILWSNQLTLTLLKNFGIKGVHNPHLLVALLKKQKQN